MGWFRRTVHPEKQAGKAKEAAALACERAIRRIEDNRQRRGVVPGEPRAIALHTINAGTGFTWVRPGFKGVSEYLTILTSEVLAYELVDDRLGGFTGRVLCEPLSSVALVAETSLAEHQFAVVTHHPGANPDEHPDSPAAVFRFSAIRDPGVSQLLVMELSLLLKQRSAGAFDCPARTVFLDEAEIRQHAGETRRCVNGQVAVPAGGQLKVPTLR